MTDYRQKNNNIDIKSRIENPMPPYMGKKNIEPVKDMTNPQEPNIIRFSKEIIELFDGEFL